MAKCARYQTNSVWHPQPPCGNARADGSRAWTCGDSWSFCIDDTPAFLVEAKAAGKKIDRYDEQLHDYFGKASVKLGILTNGVRWHFFTDLERENVMDNRPFLEWDVLKDQVPFDLLTVLHREKFDPGNIKELAKKKHDRNLVVAELSRLLAPSEEFIKLAVQNLETRKLTAAVLAWWKPIPCGHSPILTSG